ncbi:MAG: nucleotide exchange factor GrpE [Candidatus Bipolaricaulaceae bacterium]
MSENPTLTTPDKSQEEILREQLLKLAAEFDNYRKEVAKEREKAWENGVDTAVLQFLPAYEALEQALAVHQDSQQLREGLSVVLNLFREVLTRLGCTPIPAVGEEFDPLYHEALLAEPSPEPKNRVLAELERGWLRHGRVLRLAKVKVSLGPQGGDMA